MRAHWLLTLTVLSLAFAGCAEDSGPDEAPDGPTVDLEEGKGGIRGVVVDQTIVPVAGATVTLTGSGDTTTTADDGSFTFSNLDPGTYFLQATKVLYDEQTTSVEVVADDPQPDMVNIRLTKVLEGTPYSETVQFEGFYECAFALSFITDSCDMAARTAHDAGADPVPRQVLNNINTQFHTFESSTVSIIQEGFWDEAATPRMWMMVDSTPIDNGCDCSDHTYVEAESEPPTYGRTDLPDEVNAPANWPVAGEDVAIRGFVPFTESTTDVAYALDVEFDVYTTFFHNYIPQEGWNFAEKDRFPVPS